MTNTIKIHGFPLSGHSHRAELFASLTGIDHEMILVDLATGEHKKEPFLKLNPFGQVPVIDDGGVVIADSNAILVYLAKSYAPDWLPESPAAAAEVQHYLSMAAGEARYGPATARVIKVFGAPLDEKYPQKIATWLFEKLDARLQDRQWLVGERPTIADVAHYTYTAHAPEGDVDLIPYSNIRAWLQRIEALPGFVPMPSSKVGLAA